MFEQDTFEGLSVDLRDDAVGVVLFNRSKKFNALTAQTLGVLTRAVRALGEREDCGAIVISVVGQAFCAGRDLSGTDPNTEGRDPVQLVYSAMRDAVACVLAMREIPQPVMTEDHRAALRAFASRGQRRDRR